VPACDDIMLHAGTYDHASMIRNTTSEYIVRATRSEVRRVLSRVVSPIYVFPCRSARVTHRNVSFTRLREISTMLSIA
jgi:hypothetical protein